MSENTSLQVKPLVPSGSSPASLKPKVSSVKTEIPAAPAGENIDELVRKINALRSSSGNTGFVPPSSYTSAGGIPSVSPVARMESRVETASISIPEFVPTPDKDIAPRPTSSAFASPSKVVQQLQEMSKGKVDTFEQLMSDKPKTLIDEYGDAKIYRVQGEPLMYYTIPVARPTVSERAIINTLKEAATRLISITPYRIRDPEQKRNVYAQQVLEILRASPELKVPSTKFDFYAQAVVSEMVGYGLIDSLIKDDKLEEIMVIGPNVPVYVFHRKYDMMITNVEFTNDNEVQDLVNRIAREVGRRVDISSPLLDARLPDGSRVNATIPPASVSGSTLTIRKFRSDPYSIVDLINYKTLSVDVAAFLWLCVDGLGTQPANILISGGTSSGKTTLLNVLCSFIPSNERIISIEDTSELSLPLRHWIRLEGRPPGLEGKGEITLDILTKNSLRMRPDRIIVGEVRHDEAFSLFTAMNTGHDGCLIGDAKIPLTSGILEIGSFVDSKLDHSSWKEGEWDVCSIENEHITSIDSNGKLFRSSIVQARRKPFEGMVYHIKLASGNEITATGNHPFYCFEEKIVRRLAETLVIGQHVACPLRIENDISDWTQNFLGDSVLDSDVVMDEIVSIDVKSYSGFVYDLTVNESNETGKMPHNFVAEGIIVGNSMGTIHANSAQETLVRVTSPPMSVPEVMLSGLNFVIVENLFHSSQRGTYRRIMEIAEVHGVLEGKARTETVFEWDAVKDEMSRTNMPVKYFERLAQLTGKTQVEMQGELKRRERFLQGLVDRNVRDMKTVSQLSRDFLENV